MVLIQFAFRYTNTLKIFHNKNVLEEIQSYINVVRTRKFELKHTRVIIIMDKSQRRCFSLSRDLQMSVKMIT